MNSVFISLCVQLISEEIIILTGYVHILLLIYRSAEVGLMVESRASHLSNHMIRQAGS